MCSEYILSVFLRIVVHPRHISFAQAQMILYHFNRLVNAAAESLHIISTSWLNLDVRFVVPKFFIFIMSILVYFCSLSLILCFQHLHAFPSQTLHVSLRPSSCPGIRGMCGCASQILFQQLPVGVSGHTVQVTHEYPVNGGQRLTVIPT